MRIQKVRISVHCVSPILQDFSVKIHPPANYRGVELQSMLPFAALTVAEACLKAHALTGGTSGPLKHCGQEMCLVQPADQANEQDPAISEDYCHALSSFRIANNGWNAMQYATFHMSLVLAVLGTENSRTFLPNRRMNNLQG